MLLRVDVGSDEMEIASDRLWNAGAIAIEERDGGPGRVELLAGFDRADLTAPFNAVAGRWPVTVVAAGDEAAWRDAWRRHARAVRAGRRIVVQPPWVEPIGRPGDIVIEVDPGRVFGSGSHPSTTLALAVLEDHLQPGDRFLDVGSGSGVLSIAAVLFGAAEVIALDIDPEAVHITAENADRNGVADRVHASSTPLEQIPGHFPLVACNISYTAHVELATGLASHVAPGGLLVLGGILVDKWDGSTGAFPTFDLVEVREHEGWAAPVLRRP